MSPPLSLVLLPTLLLVSPGYAVSPPTPPAGPPPAGPPPAGPPPAGPPPAGPPPAGPPPAGPPPAGPPPAGPPTPPTPPSTPVPKSKKAPPPPPPPDTLNLPLVIILIVVGVFLLCGLIGVLLLVCKLQRDFSKEEKNEEKTAATRAMLDQERDQAEEMMLRELAERMRVVKENYEHSLKVHAKFVKDHDPEAFEALKNAKLIRVAGDVNESSDDDGVGRSEREIELIKQMKAMQKQTDERRKERVLENERLELEQRLVDLEMEEKMDQLKRLDQKHREQEAMESIHSSKRVTIGPDGNLIISQGLGLETWGADVPYDSEEDFDEDIPELPDHLENLNPRSLLMKKKLREMKGRLRDAKFANKQREAEMERDMTLLRLRLQQKKRRERKREHEEQKAAEAAEEAVSASPPTGAVSVRAPTNASHVSPAVLEGTGSKAKKDTPPEAAYDVPRYKHDPVPHYITAPWAVEGINTGAEGEKRARRIGGRVPRRKSNVSGLLEDMADVVTSPNPSQRARETGLVDTPPEDALRQPSGTPDTNHIP
eukprot:Sspe_Gene.59543::Locus_32716_Transcript_1_1_Confidence_1.000_Length_1715::g.59543::m.59543